MSRNGWALIVIAAVLILTAVLYVTLGRAPHGTMADTILVLTPSKDKVKPGEHFTVNIECQPGDGIGVKGYQFTLAFNPDALQIDSVQEGDFLTEDGHQSYFNAGTIDNVDGSLIDVYGAVLFPDMVSSAPGTLVTLQCTAKDPSTSSDFAFSDVIVGTKEGVAVPLQPSSVGQVDVIPSEDLNGDGVIDLADIEAVAAVFNTTDENADIDKDGRVTVLDLIDVAQVMNVA